MMKAALMYGPNDIRIEEMKRPACPEGGFVLKVCAIGLCGSDIRNLTTDSKKGRYPHVFGHEMVGMIDEISETTKNYKVGDRVYVHPGNHCLECEECRSGHSENCVNHESYTDRQGGFAEFASVTKAQAEKDSWRTVILRLCLPGKYSSWIRGYSCDYWCRTDRMFSFQAGKAERCKKSYHDRDQ